MASRVQQLARAYREVQKMDSKTIEVTLRDENIDKWEVKYHFSDNRQVILLYEFHLVDNLPPKITVVFPASINYVCFQELGKSSWDKNSDVLTIIFAIQQEMQDRAKVYSSSEKMSDKDADTQWKFVQSSHTDWNYVDITELTDKMDKAKIAEMRKEGEKALSSSQELANSGKAKAKKEKKGCIQQ